MRRSTILVLRVYRLASIISNRHTTRRAFLLSTNAIIPEGHSYNTSHSTGSMVVDWHLTDNFLVKNAIVVIAKSSPRTKEISLTFT
jgi:hypothetical protein